MTQSPRRTGFVARALIGTLRLPGRLVVTTARLIAFGAFLLAFGLSVSMVTAFSGTVYDLATRLGSSFISVPDVSGTRTSAKQAELDRANKTIADREGKLRTQNVKLRQADAQLARARADNAALRRDAHVVYRGKYQTVRKATQEYAELMARRLHRLAITNIASMAGEAVPYIGAAVIVSATVYEVAETCGMMTDIREFTDALEIVSEIDANIVCGLEVPSLEELIDKVKGSSDNVISRLPDILPTWDFSDGMDDLSEKVGRLWQ